jgi:hypothetical protein
MAADHRSNGEDPFPPLLRNPLQQRPRMKEIVEVLDEGVFEGPIGKRIASSIGALVTRADQHSSDMDAFSRVVFDGFSRGDGILRGMHGAIQELKVVVMGKMRPETPSAVDAVDGTRKSFGQHLQELANKAPGGLGKVLATPAEIEQAADGYFEERMALYLQKKRVEELEAADAKAKSDAAEAIVVAKRDAEDKHRQRRTFWVLVASGTVVAIVGILGTYLSTKATEHERGFAEGVKAAPTVVVATTIPVDTASASAQVPVAPAKTAK